MKLQSNTVTRVLVLFLLTISASGCAFGPLYSHETAQTVGAKRLELGVGYGNASYLAKLTFGIFDNVDIGVHLEALSVGLRLKYAFISNHTNGTSASITAGAGESYGGTYYTGAGSISYLTGVFEPYLTLRGVYVYYSNTNTNYVFNGPTINLPEFSYSYSYLEPLVGFRLWVTQDHLYLSAEVGGIIVGGSTSVIASGGLGFRF